MLAEQPPFNPWRDFWLQPRATIRRIVGTKADRDIAALTMIFGVTGALDFLILTDIVSSRLEAGIAILVGILLAFATISLTGRSSVDIAAKLGGTAMHEEALAAVAWSLGIPAIFFFFFLLPPFLFLMMTGDRTNPLLILYSQLLWVVRIGVYLWMLVLGTVTQAEVNEFSNWRGLLVFLLSTILYVVLGVITNIL